MADDDEGQLFDQLVAAWEAWEHQPGSHGAVLKYEIACQNYAKFAGLTTVELRTMLAAGRRRGLEMDDVITRVVGLWA